MQNQSIKQLLNPNTIREKTNPEEFLSFADSYLYDPTILRVSDKNPKREHIKNKKVTFSNENKTLVYYQSKSTRCISKNEFKPINKSNPLAEFMPYAHIPPKTVHTAIDLIFPLLKTFSNPLLFESMAAVILPVFVACSVLSCVLDAIELSAAIFNQKKAPELKKKGLALLEKTAITAVLAAAIFCIAPVLPSIMCVVLTYQAAQAFYTASQTHRAINEAGNNADDKKVKQLTTERNQQLIKALGLVCVLASIAVASFATFGIGMAVAIGVLAVASVCLNGVAYKNTVQNLLKKERTEPNPSVIGKSSFFKEPEPLNEASHPHSSQVLNAS